MCAVFPRAPLLIKLTEVLSSIHFESLLMLQLALHGADPSNHRAKEEYTLDELPVYHRADIERLTSTLTHTRLNNLKPPIKINVTITVFGLWEEGREPEENQAQGEHANMPELNLGPSSCEVTALATALLCHTLTEVKFKSMRT